MIATKNLGNTDSGDGAYTPGLIKFNTPLYSIPRKRIRDWKDNPNDLSDVLIIAEMGTQLSSTTSKESSKFGFSSFGGKV